MKDQDCEGIFIVVEGADGAGTTTQAEKLAEELDAYYTAEPSQNRAGKKVEAMISSGDYSPQAIGLMFAADRMVHLEEEVIPRLEKGETVVCDRYYHSSLVYQPALGANFEWVKKLNRAALRPDLTLIIDVPADTGMKRVEDRGTDDNIFENLNFQQEVVARYRKLPDRLEGEAVNVDGSRGIEEVFSDILSEVNSRLKL